MGPLSTVGVPDPRRLVPRTDTVLGDPRLVDAARRLGASTVKEAVRRSQERARRGEIAPESVADEAVSRLPRYSTSLRPVLNATGVVLHTNIGRARSPWRPSMPWSLLRHTSTWSLMLKPAPGRAGGEAPLRPYAVRCLRRAT